MVSKYFPFYRNLWVMNKITIAQLESAVDLKRITVMEYDELRETSQNVV